LKTKWMKEYFVADTGFKDDLAALCRLSDEQVSCMVGWIADVSTRWRTRDARDTQLLSAVTGLPGGTASRVLGLVRYMADELDEHQDSPADLVSDLVEMDLVSAELQDVVTRHLVDLLGALGPVLGVDRDMLTEAAVVPSFVGITAAADLRLRVKRRFDADSERAEDYAPELAALVPVGLCRIRVTESSTGQRQQFAFQLSANELERVINVLVVLQKEMLLLGRVARDCEAGGG
jgi:hypothetical protein